MINKLLQKIEEYNDIIILRHNRPDLDALGSQRGLSIALKTKYPNKNIYITGDMNNKLSFLGSMDIIDDETFKKSLVIICDVAVSYMVSDDRYKLAKEVFIIDHHTNLSDITINVIIDSTKSACAELIAKILYDNGFKVNSSAATALFGGIVTDSGRFQYSSTTSETFIIASKLINDGADIQYIYNNIYVESLANRKMKNYFSNIFQVTENGVAFIKSGPEVFKKFNVDFFSISRGMVNVMAGIDEVIIWLNFTYDQTKNAIIGEFRSRGIKIVDIAKKYGGGGHDEACGATLKNWDEVDMVINDYNQLAKEYK